MGLGKQPKTLMKAQVDAAPSTTYPAPATPFGALPLVGSAEAEEIERHGSPPGCGQMWIEVVVDEQVARESVQQHKSRPTAWKVPDIQASASVLKLALGESWKTSSSWESVMISSTLT